MISRNQLISDTILSAAHSLSATSPDYGALLGMIEDKSVVLLGEATHGTHEFYEARIEITKNLILDHGLNAIAIEGDWPSAYRINRYIRWQGNDKTANEALGDFKRFPLWMWRNRPMLDFVSWLRQHNENLPTTEQVGLYGLDMYSLYDSISAVLEYLDHVDPTAASEARLHYSCLGHAGQEGYYGHQIKFGRRLSCETEVVEQLLRLRRNAMKYAMKGDVLAEDDHFQAEQNARLIHSAESYYRQMFDHRVNTWNLRDTHMMETLDNLHQHLSKRLARSAKIAVWEHNSHIGDARATYMGSRGQHNLGQLARQRFNHECALVGFTTYTGTVTAASEWGAPAERKRVIPALRDSVEDIFHRTGLAHFMLPLQGDVAELFNEYQLQRAIGVVYLPESERSSHYFQCQLKTQFDVVFHFDHTRAIEPLDPTSEWQAGEESTYPFGV